MHGEPLTDSNVGWWLPETLCYLRHLELSGRVARDEVDSGVGRWVAS